MYKVGEVAEKLNVPSVLIHEKLINNRALLDPYIQKTNSITYINERGLEILDTLIHGGVKETPTPKLDEKPLKVEKKSQDKTHKEVAPLRTKKDKHDLERERLLKEIEILFNEMDNMNHQLQLQSKAILELQDILDQDLESFKLVHSQILDKENRR